jgi:3-keto-disaccharide hydrolase
MDSFETLSFDTPGAWAMAGAGRFVSAGPGLLESEGGSGLLWYSLAEFSDFRLQVDWLAHALEDNSGVFFRFPTAELARKQPDWKAGFEVQIDERGVDPEHDRMGSPLHLTGALYTLAPAVLKASRPLGEWNTFDILAGGLELRVVLNGVEVCTFTAPAHKPRAGRIGLQAHHAGSRVRFRAPRIQRL